jgi:hypothetical protein
VPKGAVDTMTARERQREARWRTLVRDVQREITSFQEEYALAIFQEEVLPGRRLEPFYRKPRRASLHPHSIGSSKDQDDAIRAHRELLGRKRKRWSALWCKAADMVTAYETEYARSPPDHRVWAQRAADRMRAGLESKRRELHVIHSDMPEIVDLKIDPGTGKHHPVVSAMDVLEAIYFGVYEDEDNDEDDARDMTDIERAQMAQRGRELRAFLDFHSSVRQ